MKSINEYLDELSSPVAGAFVYYSNEKGECFVDIRSCVTAAYCMERGASLLETRRGRFVEDLNMPIYTLDSRAKLILDCWEIGEERPVVRDYYSVAYELVIAKQELVKREGLVLYSNTIDTLKPV